MRTCELTPYVAIILKDTTEFSFSSFKIGI